MSLRIAMLCMECKNVLNSEDNIFGTSCGHLYHFDCLFNYTAISAECSHCKSYKPYLIKMYLTFGQAWEDQTKTITLNNELEKSKRAITYLEEKYKLSQISVQKLEGKIKKINDELNSRIITQRDLEDKIETLEAINKCLCNENKNLTDDAENKKKEFQKSTTTSNGKTEYISPNTLNETKSLTNTTENEKNSKETCCQNDKIAKENIKNQTDDLANKNKEFKEAVDSPGEDNKFINSKILFNKSENNNNSRDKYGENNILSKETEKNETNDDANNNMNYIQHNATSRLIDKFNGSDYLNKIVEFDLSKNSTPCRNVENSNLYIVKKQEQNLPNNAQNTDNSKTLVISNYLLKDLRKFSLKNIVIYIASKMGISIPITEIKNVNTLKQDSKYASISVTFENIRFKQDFILNKERLKRFSKTKSLKIQD